MSFTTDHLVFIDFEASGLDANSWPVEVGLTIIAGGQLQTWSSLIKPEPDWPARSWDARAEQIHGISRTDLDGAPAAADVARELLARIGQRSVVSDAPGFDWNWCFKLVDVIDAVPPRFQDVDRIVKMACKGQMGAMLVAFSHLSDAPREHRVGADTERMATAFVKGMSML
ncbi:3'-5' exonuclease [Loktanella sp. M215]|uniref:3'-5' exonuclease n=1 Tax=Loktanella sp. M215 TaxID=2675431 RepID=UPI001F231C86|nr:exonuclease domain-containing protein [Loktanella sp. M215]MCF7699876.1 hypothetical protein [Loktanella sp. M215]